MAKDGSDRSYFNKMKYQKIFRRNAEILSGMAGLVCKEFAEMEITESMYSSLKNSINAANPTVNKRKDMEVY